MKHWMYKESRYFQKFIFIQKWWRKKHVVYLDNYKHALLKVAKQIVPKLFHMKKPSFGEKGYTFLFYINIVGSLYLICTTLQYLI
jgi:hypothetical protein